MFSRRSTFKRGERLKHRKVINELFKSSRRKHIFPVHVLFSTSHVKRSSFPAQAAFVVPRKNIREPVLRNKLKRRMKEAYRFNKHRLYSGLPDSSKPLSMIFIYASSEQQPYHMIEQAIIKVIDQIVVDCNRL